MELHPELRMEEQASLISTLNLVYKGKWPWTQVQGSGCGKSNSCLQPVMCKPENKGGKEEAGGGK